MLKWKNKDLSHLDRKKLVRNSGTYAILLMSLVAMTFFGVCSPRGQMDGVSGHAAKVASEEINSFEFRRAYSNMYQRFQGQFSENFDPATLGLAKMVLKQLIDDRIMYLAAIDSGIEAQPTDVERLLIEGKAFRDDKGQFSEEAFNNYLRANGYTEASFTAELRRSLTVQKFRQFFGSTQFVSSKTSALDQRLQNTKIDIEYIKLNSTNVNVAVTDSDIQKFLDDVGKAKVKEYYDSHATEFKQEEQIKARHILVQYTGARNASAEAAKRSKDDAKKRIDQILAKVKAPGADFAKLAKENTDEPSGKTSGGDLGFFNKQTMDPKFTEASFALAKGAVSGVVETPFGFHIIKVEDKKEAKATSLEAATKGIAEKLLAKTKAPEALKAKADQTLADLKASKKVNEEWKATGPTALSSRYFSGLGSDEKVVLAATALKNNGDLSPIIDVGEEKYILRLKSRTEAAEKVDEAKLAEASQSSANSMGYSIMTSYEKSLRKNLEEKGRIWENPKYVEIDKKKSSSSPADDAAGG